MWSADVDPLLHSGDGSAVLTPDFDSGALPERTERAVLQLADGSDLLLFGEIHGIREVPRVVAGLLPKLTALGYRGLALELPAPERDPLAGWARGDTPQPPSCFPHPAWDGRANVQVLGLVRASVAAGWQVLCIDQSPDQPMVRWADRDHWMARNLWTQWQQLCPTGKIVGICGNLHARVRPDSSPGSAPVRVLGWLQRLRRTRDELGPSLAGWVQQEYPEVAVHSIMVTFQTGSAFFNGRVQRLGPFRVGRVGSGFDPRYSLVLRLPQATAATFLAHPRG